MLWEMSLSLSHFLWCVNLVEFYFDHLDTTNAEMPYEKNKHLGAIVFFFSIDINIYI